MRKGVSSKSLTHPFYQVIESIALVARDSSVLHLVNDSLESGGVVEGEVGKHLTVDFDARLVDESHQLAIAEVFQTCGSVDTLNPESTEVALLVLTVAISIGETFFPGVLGNGPHIATASEVTAGEF